MFVVWGVKKYLSNSTLKYLLRMWKYRLGFFLLIWIPCFSCYFVPNVLKDLGRQIQFPFSAEFYSSFSSRMSSFVRKEYPLRPLPYHDTSVLRQYYRDAHPSHDPPPSPSPNPAPHPPPPPPPPPGTSVCSSRLFDGSESNMDVLKSNCISCGCVWCVDTHQNSTCIDLVDSPGSVCSSYCFGDISSCKTTLHTSSTSSKRGGFCLGSVLLCIGVLFIAVGGFLIGKYYKKMRSGKIVSSDSNDVVEITHHVLPNRVYRTHDCADLETNVCDAGVCSVQCSNSGGKKLRRHSGMHQMWAEPALRIGEIEPVATPISTIVVYPIAYHATSTTGIVIEPCDCVE